MNYSSSFEIQALPRLNKFEEALKRATKRAYKYVERALEEADKEVVKNIQGVASFAGWQLNETREVWNA